MKIGIIAPEAFLELQDRGDFYMIIAPWLLTSPVYRNFFTMNKRKYKILDNGAFEGNAIDDKTLIELAKRFRVDEIVCPDVPLNGLATLERTKKFIEIVLTSNIKCKLQAVPQGMEHEEYLKCFTELSKLPIDVIGLAKRPIKQCFSFLSTGNFSVSGIRLAALQSLQKRNFLDEIKQEFHLLGLENPLELFMLRNSFVRSCDSSAPFRYGFEKIYFEHLDRFTEIDKKLDFSIMGRSVTSLLGIVEFNINALKTFCDSGESLRVYFKLITKEAKLPNQAYTGDACFDLFSIEDKEIEAGKTGEINFGIQIAVPYGYESILRPRSSQGKASILMHPGTIDAGYRGTLSCIVFNYSDKPYIIKQGQKVAQLAIRKVPKIEFVQVNELPLSERGDRGFGSSGM